MSVLASDDGADEQRVSVMLGPQLVGAAWGAGPLVPQLSAAAGGSVRLHIIVDHSIITVICNNRSAITTYVRPRDANSTGIALFGVDGSTITATWQAWALRGAVINNNSTLGRGA